MKNPIKIRKAKSSKRGIYLQDKELLHTNFQYGTHFKYIVDAINKKVVILPSQDQSDNQVSKRAIKSGIKPVIDIRSKEALSIFQEVPFFQIEIYGDQIIVEAFEQVDQEEQQNRTVVKTSSKKIYDIRQVLKVKQLGTLQCTKAELKKAVGQVDTYQQLEIFDFLSNDESKQNVTYIQQALKNVHIPLQVISLFSGAGLLDFAFKELGYDIIFALEKDKEIAKTYRHNIGEIVTEDIRDFDKKRLPFAPIIIGGSPCKGFSNSNRYSNFLDNPNNLLVREYIKCVQQVNPYVFVLENVPQILTAGNGKFFNEIKTELSEYKITAGVISSAQYGDPQDRKRAFLVGSRLNEVIHLPSKLLRPDQYTTVRKAFEGIHSLLPNQQDISSPKPITLKRIKHVGPGGNVFDIPEEIRPKGQHSDMYKRLEWDKPSVTIVNPRKAMLLHPEENRILSIREACRLFSLPDSFIFKGTLSAMQEAIANSVPIKLGKAIASKVKDAITTFNIRNRICTNN